MCGISGIYHFSPEAQTSAKNIQEMNTSLHHRGPDAAGTLVSGQFGLASARLKIIDIDGGQQPISNREGSISVTFNGEIYNYREIRQSLSAQGYLFQSESEIEVILKAYEHWGIDCVQHFNGMFAIALVDKKEQCFYLVRDRLGIKPLYYYLSETSLFFASEPKAILRGSQVSPELNKSAVLDYMRFRYPLSEKSFFEDIKAVPAGKIMKVNTKGIGFHCYWSLETSTLKVDEQEAIENTKQLLTEAVERRMISDVELGAFLSGGLDSSILVAIMSQLSDKPIKTFNIGFKEEGFNEFTYANDVSKMWGTEHHSFTLDSQSYIDSIEKVICFKDAPLAVPNEVAIYHLSQELRKHVTVVLSGEGADELFGGYGRIFRSAYDYERIYGQSSLNETELEILKAKFFNKFKGKEFDNPQSFFLNQYSYVPEGELSKLLNKDYFDIKTSNSSFMKAFKQIEELPLSEQFMCIFQQLHLPGLLGRLDNATMANAVEGRVPFVDHKLIEYISQLPADLKMKWRSEEAKENSRTLMSHEISETYDCTKYLLRKAFAKDLPSSVMDRKKVGFPVPLQKIIGKKFLPFAKEILLDHSVQKRAVFAHKELSKFLNNEQWVQSPKGSMTIWMMLNFELWAKNYLDN